jgi:hypothetical protein
VDDRLLQLAASQHGLITRTQARRVVGASFGAVDHLVRSGRWEPVGDEVLRLKGSPPGRGQLVMSKVLDAGPDGRLAYRSAARWWGVTGASLEPVHVVRTSRSHRRPEGVVLHTARSVPDRWTARLDGVPIVRPELLALQLFASEPWRRAERWVDALWSMRLLDGRSLARLLHDLGARGRNGTAGLREYLEPRGQAYVPPASGLESRTMQVLSAAGIDVVPQVDSGDEERWTARVDFRHRWLPVIVEVQSERHHAALSDRSADRERIEQLRAAGYAVVEVTDVEVWTQPDLVIARVAAAIASLTAA